jgi:hypothetical protein
MDGPKSLLNFLICGIVDSRRRITHKIVNRDFCNSSDLSSIG